MAFAGSSFILPKGITGFGDRHWMPEPHDLFKELKALSHDVARRARGHVAASKPSDLAGTNFHILHLEARELRIAILVNAFFPLVGFAETMTQEGGEPTFVDVPDDFLASNCGPFTFIGKAILISFPGEESLAHLAPAEIGQVQYWRPRRLGDIIFNHWD